MGDDPRFERMAEPGQHVWVITDESPSWDDEPGYSCVGVFTTRERALEYLRLVTYGDQIVDAFEWYQSPHNAGFWEGWMEDAETGRERRITMCVEEIDEVTEMEGVRMLEEEGEDAWAAWHREKEREHE